MYDGIFVLLALLFIKHWYVDFVDQTAEEVKWKGTYFDWRGVKHSVKHGVATAIIMSFFVYAIEDMIILGLIDFVIHYHIDWAKMQFKYKPDDKRFWWLLGLDQMLHYLTYVGIIMCGHN